MFLYNKNNIQLNLFTEKIIYVPCWSFNKFWKLFLNLRIVSDKNKTVKFCTNNKKDMVNEIISINKAVETKFIS